MPLEFKPLAEILRTADHLAYGLLYMQGDYPWDGSSLGIIYSRDDGYDLERENPEFSKENNLKIVLEIGAVQDVVFNARLQKPDVDVHELVQAFNHYYKYDGFLKL